MLWGKMCAYLLSKDTFYYSASIKDKGYEKYIFWCLKVIQSHRKKIWVSTVHHVGEINCQTLKKKRTVFGIISLQDNVTHMGHIALEEYYAQICLFFLIMDNQYTKMVDSGGSNVVPLF